MKKLCMTLLCGVTLVAGAPLAVAADYQFEVDNQTSQAITAVRASENKTDWSEFTLSEEVPSKSSVTLEWAEHTNDSGCEWWVQVDYKDGSSSEPAQFDFCKNPSLVVSD